MNDTSAQSNATAEDSELVVRAQAGDVEAMNQLLTRHFGYVTNLCRRILRDPVDAEDARQDALIQAARAIASFDQRSSFRTWLHTLTRNVCLNAIRSASRRAQPVAEPAEYSPRHPRYEEPVAERLDVEAALAAISPVFRDALVLWFIYDFDYAQIADALDIPVNTVRSRLRRGKAELAQLLGDPPQPPPVSKVVAT